MGPRWLRTDGAIPRGRRETYCPLTRMGLIGVGQRAEYSPVKME